MTYYYLNSPTLRATARCVPLLLVMLPLIVTAALPKESILIGEVPTPSPELDPPEVVRIQIEALRKNSILNEGIRLAYRFASPDNKRYTGPLNRFIEMVRSPPYHWLLNHVKAYYGPVAVSGTEAYQLVTITDKGGGSSHIRMGPFPANRW